MASLPAQHPSLSLHLTDLSLTPLITSSSSRAHLESLTSLASSAITSSVAAQRANLGRPQRIMVEYPDSGAVVLHSFLHPPAAEQHEEGSNSNSNNLNSLNTSRDDAGDTSISNSNQIHNPNPSGGNDSGDNLNIRNSSSSARSAGAGANNNNSNSNSNSNSNNDMGVNNSDNDEDGVPLLVGLVVAGSRDQAREARRVAARLERVGREFQREWAAQGALHRPEEE